MWKYLQDTNNLTKSIQKSKLMGVKNVIIVQKMKQSMK